MENYSSPQDIHIRPRVFVSSVIEGFQAYREVARQAIKNSGGEPILVNEDFPSLMDSPRNVCLDAVDSADFFISIVGERGGWKTPSGKLVMEEEYERACLKKLPILVFLQDIERDSDAQIFAKRLSDYIDGSFRVAFKSPAELKAKLEKSLTPLLSRSVEKHMKKDELIKFLEEPYLIADETSLRFILAPEREEEVIDPIIFDHEDFIRNVYAIGHSKEVNLFDYLRQKEQGIEEESLVIHQFDPRGSRKDTIEEVRLELNESGQIVIDSNVTHRVIRGQHNSGFLDMMVVACEDIETVLNASFRFVAALFDSIDRFKRYQRFFYNVVLSNIGYRELVKEPKEQSSYSSNVFRDNKPIIVFNEPRIINRIDLHSPKDEISRVLVLLARKLKS